MEKRDNNEQGLRHLRYTRYPCGLEIHIEGYDEQIPRICPLHGTTCGTKKVISQIPQIMQQMPQTQRY